MKKILFFFYSIFLFFVCIFSYAYIDSNLYYLSKIYSDLAFKERPFVTVVFISILAVFFAFYFTFVSLYKQKKFTLPDIKITIAITIALLLLSYPAMLSFDIFNYLATAKVLFLYHENPYVIMPIAFTGDPLLLFMHAANKTALYGFVWILLTGIPYFLGLGNFLITLFSFKLFIAAFYLFTCILIYALSDNKQSLVFFALNPLVVIESLVSGHNDTVMITLLLLSIFYFKKKKLLWGIGFFVLSVFIKYATLILLPIVIYLTIRTINKQSIDWQRIYFLIAVCMGTVVVFSSLREEIYPWYATWFLAFSYLVPEKKLLLYMSHSVSFGLLLRYVPFMLLGTYFGVTPLIKIFVTIASLMVGLLFYIISEKVWLKKYFHYSL